MCSMTTTVLIFVCIIFGVRVFMSHLLVPSVIYTPHIRLSRFEISKTSRLAKALHESPQPYRQLDNIQLLRFLSQLDQLGRNNVYSMLWFSSQSFSCHLFPIK
jgi:hypothetical protein